MSEMSSSVSGQRLRILIAGAAIQLCAGIIYMWSVFKQPVADHLAWDAGASALTASVMLVAFVTGILICGRVMDIIGPKKTCIAGSVMMSAGILASSLVTASDPCLIYLTYGAIGGFGVGTVYTCTVSTIQKWFCDRRGFATGVMVGAFGFSLVLFAPLASYLLAEVGVPSTFRFFGLAFLVVCTACSFAIVKPPADYLPAPGKASACPRRQYTPREMLRTRRFYLIALSLFFVLPAYFILNPLFVSLGIERGLSESLAVMGVMITGICSASGRLAITWMSDHIGRMVSLLLIIGLTSLGVLLAILAEGMLFVACLAMIAFAFGGAAGIYATVTSDHFGTENMGSNYGFVMLGFGASALVFPFVSNIVAADGDYTMAFVICALTCVASLICILLLRSETERTAAEGD